MDRLFALVLADEMNQIDEAMRSYVGKVCELEAGQRLIESAETVPADDSDQLSTIPLVEALQAELDGVMEAQTILSELVLKCAASTKRANILKGDKEMRRVETLEKISDCVDRLEAGNEVAMAFAAQVRRWMVLLDEFRQAKQDGGF